MSKITEEQIRNIVENTKTLRDNFKKCALYDYTDLTFSVLGKTPFRDDMCICREGSLVISPQLLFSPNSSSYSIDEIAEQENIVIEARILFLNNYKLQFNEHPVKRFKKSIANVGDEISAAYDQTVKAAWSVIETPDVNLWRLSLMQYISTKVFLKRSENGGHNRLQNFWN